MADRSRSEKDQDLDPNYEEANLDIPRLYRQLTVKLPDQAGGLTTLTLTIPPELKYDGVWEQSGGLQPEGVGGSTQKYKSSLTLAFLQETQSGTYYPIHITATGYGKDVVAAKDQLAKNMEFVIRAKVWEDEGEALDLDNDGTYEVIRAGDDYRYPLYAEYELPEIPWNLSYVPNAKISADNWAQQSNNSLSSEIRSGVHTNQFGEVGCPVCGSINEFWKVSGDTGSRYTCMDCFYASGDFYVIIKSRGDKTLSDYGMKIFCEFCQKDIEGLKTRGDLKKHIKSHEKLDSYKTEAGGVAHPKTRMTRKEADKIIKGIEKKLTPWVTRMEVCGSYRRGRQDPGDLDIILIPAPGISLPELIKNKLKIPESKIHWLGEKKAQVDIKGYNIDFRTSSPDGWGAALLYFTGPSGYNIGMRVRAKKMGFKLNEYGVFNRTTGDYLGGKTEDEVYKLLNKTPKLPELRAEQYIFPNQQSGVGVGKVERKKKK
jgi:predicted nucleotidyltransferase